MEHSVCFVPIYDCLPLEEIIPWDEADATFGASPICPSCGENTFLDLLEVWHDTREFMLNACCEVVHEMAVDELREAWCSQGRRGKEQRASLRAAQEFFWTRAQIQLRQVITEPRNSGTWKVDWGVEIRPVPFRSACRFINDHHRHNRAPISWKWGYGIYNGADLIGVATVERPKARMIATREPGTVEVSRVCLNHDLEPGLVWNACSMVYGRAAKDAEARGYSKIISYTLETEEGTSLAAAGFAVEFRSKGGTWSRGNRPREDKAPVCAKLRWARFLSPRVREPEPIMAAPELQLSFF